MHPTAVAADHGLDLSDARPVHISEIGVHPDLVVSVCDTRIRAYVPATAEHRTRDLLRAVAKNDGKVPNDMPTVLFLCVHNAGR